MSSSSGPYKSKLFNAINHRVRQWGDRLEVTFRQLQGAAQWGLQLLLYPIYLLVQGKGHEPPGLEAPSPTQNPLPPAAPECDRSEPPERQTPPPQLPLTPPTPSRPIQQVLAGLNPWLPSGFVILEPKVSVSGGQLASQKTAMVASELPSDFQVTIRGIATQLSNRRLVLVTANNQVLDLLCDEQIQQLEQRLAEAIATYWEQRIYLQTAAKQGIVGNRDASLAPVRFFWQTIDLVQRSPWLRKLNFFNESTLVDLLASRPWLTVSATKLVAVADRTLAQVESRVAQLRKSVANSPAKPTAPSNETNPGQLSALIQAAVDYFFGGRSQSLSGSGDETARLPQGTTPLVPAVEQHPGNSAIARWLTQQGAQLGTLTHPLSRSLTQTLVQAGQRLDHWRAETLDASGTGDPFQISRLIQAAVDYFFGGSSQGKGQISGKNQPFHLAAPGETTALPLMEEDPWLSWEDLFGKPEGISSTSKTPAPLVALPAGLPVPSAKALAVKRQRSAVKSQELEETLDGTSSLAIASLQPQSIVLDSPSETVNEDLALPLEVELEESTTWIETEAIAVGYVKHPLERVLEWLDRVILWLEETVAALWRWLQQQLSKSS